MDNSRFRFRAWDKFNEDMFFSGESLSKFFQQVERLIKGGNHVEVTQYTGLKGKDGTELCIGDIYLPWKDAEPREAKDLLQIGYEYHESILNEGEDGFEIIGNIYENPELLEE